MVVVFMSFSHVFVTKLNATIKKMVEREEKTTHELTNGVYILRVVCIVREKIQKSADVICIAFDAFYALIFFVIIIHLSLLDKNIDYFVS